MFILERLTSYIEKFKKECGNFRGEFCIYEMCLRPFPFFSLLSFDNGKFLWNTFCAWKKLYFCKSLYPFEVKFLRRSEAMARQGFVILTSYYNSCPFVFVIVTSNRRWEATKHKEWVGFLCEVLSSAIKDFFLICKLLFVDHSRLLSRFSLQALRWIFHTSTTCTSFNQERFRACFQRSRLWCVINTGNLWSTTTFLGDQSY